MKSGTGIYQLFKKLVSLISRNLEIIFDLTSTANYTLKFSHLFKSH